MIAPPTITPTKPKIARAMQRRYNHDRRYISGGYWRAVFIHDTRNTAFQSCWIAGTINADEVAVSRL